MSAATLNLSSTPEAPKNWGPINPNINDYHSETVEISRTFLILVIIDWWHQQEEIQ
jgi:hypothetical protein